jgi:hypothetical protein
MSWHPTKISPELSPLPAGLLTWYMEKVQKASIDQGSFRLGVEVFRGGRGVDFPSLPGRGVGLRSGTQARLAL